jgi:membrane protein DedA with SNARE-associated domain
LKVRAISCKIKQSDTVWKSYQRNTQGVIRLEPRELIFHLLQHYGYIGLYLLFIIDTLGVFLPSKTILIISGFLVSQGFIKHLPLFIAALAGSLTGFFTGYQVGTKVGKPFLDKYGKCIYLTPKLLRKAEKWFDAYGTAAILIAYFIPGLRHIVPYLSGIAQMPVRKVMLCAFSGATLWVLTFTLIGRFLGNNWSTIINILNNYRLEIGGTAAAMALVSFLVRRAFGKNYNNKRA